MIDPRNSANLIKRFKRLWEYNHNLPLSEERIAMYLRIDPKRLEQMLSCEVPVQDVEIYIRMSKLTGVPIEHFVEIAIGEPVESKRDKSFLTIVK